MERQLLLWSGFLLFVIAMLAVDLGLFHRKAHVIHMREALTWTAVWIGLALAFNAGIAYFWGTQAGVEFLTGYLVEKSLSMDNVFVFLLIFSYFKTPPNLQYKVLFWGIIGAILARSVFIVAGLALLETFHWTMYVFGSFLLATGIWMVVKKGGQYDPERNPVIRLFRRWVPITESYEGDQFFVRKAGRLVATPLLIVLLAVESSDIVFAVDSIPAIFAITQDHFIVYTSNIFAMLGLRAMYFAVASFMRSFHYLHYGFASIIVILGIKMLVSDVYHVPVTLSLVLIVLILMSSMIASLLRPRAEDLKRMLQRSQRLGLLSFRRLLLLENVFQLERLRVREVMRPGSRVRVLQADAPWEVNARTMAESRFSRYPLVGGVADMPLGIVHVKDHDVSRVRESRSTMWSDCGGSNRPLHRGGTNRLHVVAVATVAILASAARAVALQLTSRIFREWHDGRPTVNEFFSDSESTLTLGLKIDLKRSRMVLSREVREVGRRAGRQALTPQSRRGVGQSCF